MKSWNVLINSGLIRIQRHKESCCFIRMFLFWQLCPDSVTADDWGRKVGFFVDNNCPLPSPGLNSACTGD